jgi:hypothetical protein
MVLPPSRTEAVFRPEQAPRQCEHFVWFDPFHATMVERTDTALAWAAFDLLLHVDSQGMEGLRPGDMGRSEQGEDGAVEGAAEVSWSAVGGDEEVAASDAGFSESD